MKLFITIGIVALMSACNSQNSKPLNENQSNIHEVVVEEVLQTSRYTYLRVKENDSEQWLAVPKIQAKIGGTYYYEGGFKMTNFESKELNRTFETVIFLERISAEPITAEKPVSPVSPHTSKSTTEKKDITIEHAEGGITIAELFSNKESYAGKIVKIRGQVTKFNASIMDKNWIHLQDGTDYNGKFDLTVTSDIELNVGVTVTVEGKITLDKDFGFGYFYEVIMEEAKLLN